MCRGPQRQSVILHVIVDKLRDRRVAVAQAIVSRPWRLDHPRVVRVRAPPRPTQIYGRGSRVSKRPRKLLSTYLRFIVNPLCMSVNVRTSTEWTPGFSAKKSILTDWQVEGSRGLP